jgi:cysteine desulfurase / selenocysteine lyase
MRAEAPLTPSTVRELFPALKSLTWLNAAASSPMATAVHEAIVSNVNETLSQGDIAFPQWISAKETLRENVATYLGCLPKELAFTPSTSFGFNVCAAMLKAKGIKRVLTLDGEFPSTTLPFLHHEMELNVVRSRVDGSFHLDDIKAACDVETKAVAVSLVQFASGFRVDIEGLAQFCKEKKLILCLNGAQALGQMPIDLKKWGASFFAATSHKWFFGGYGVGTLFIAENWLSEKLPQAGWLSVSAQEQFHSFPFAHREPSAFGFKANGMQSRAEASAIEVGGGVWSSFAGFAAALSIHQRIGTDEILKHNIMLQLALREGLRKRNFIPNTPDDAVSLSGISVVPVVGAPIDSVRRLLRERKIATTARGVGVRIATHIYNSLHDVEALLAAFDELNVGPG